MFLKLFGATDGAISAMAPKSIRNMEKSKSHKVKKFLRQIEYGIIQCNRSTKQLQSIYKLYTKTQANYINENAFLSHERPSALNYDEIYKIYGTSQNYVGGHKEWRTVLFFDNAIVYAKFLKYV